MYAEHSNGRNRALQTAGERKRSCTPVVLHGVEVSERTTPSFSQQPPPHSNVSQNVRFLWARGTATLKQRHWHRFGSRLASTATEGRRSLVWGRMEMVRGKERLQKKWVFLVFPHKINNTWIPGGMRPPKIECAGSTDAPIPTSHNSTVAVQGFRIFDFSQKRYYFLDGVMACTVLKATDDEVPMLVNPAFSMKDISIPFLMDRGYVQPKANFLTAEGESSLPPPVLLSTHRLRKEQPRQRPTLLLWRQVPPAFHPIPMSSYADARFLDDDGV